MNKTSSNKTLKILIISTLIIIAVLLFTGILSIRFNVDFAHLTQKLAIATEDKENIKSTENQNNQITSTDELLPERKDIVTLVIPAKQQRSYWLAMERDYSLDYSWNTDRKPIYAELRGKHKGDNNKNVKIFAKTTSDKTHGLFIIPFTGHFSWYWDNKTDQAITVRFAIKGAYKIVDAAN